MRAYGRIGLPYYLEAFPDEAPELQIPLENSQFVKDLVNGGIAATTSIELFNNQSTRSLLFFGREGNTASFIDVESSICEAMAQDAMMQGVSDARIVRVEFQRGWNSNSCLREPVWDYTAGEFMNGSISPKINPLIFSAGGVNNTKEDSGLLAQQSRYTTRVGRVRFREQWKNLRRFAAQTRGHDHRREYPASAERTASRLVQRFSAVDFWCNRGGSDGDQWRLGTWRLRDRQHLGRSALRPVRAQSGQDQLVYGRRWLLKRVSFGVVADHIAVHARQEESPICSRHSIPDRGGIQPVEGHLCPILG